ncbi:MAG: YbdD/YjiX family protein [Burkholderiales bacterium]|jgi:uncharacterized short protein YbdD (DUF466 family)
MPRLTDWFAGDDKLAAELGASPDRLQALADKVVQIRKALRGVIGVPDYELYLSRHKVIHPDVPPMNEEEFFRFAIDRRYGGRGGGVRCC